MAKKTSSFNLVGTLEPYFEKAPAMPKKWQLNLVKITPWIAVIFGVLGVLVGVSSFGIFSVASPFVAMGGADGVSAVGSGFLALAILLISSVLMLMAFPGLKGNKVSGWNLLFWSQVVSIVGSVVELHLVNAIIGALIGFYLLFQIKSYYK
jgi:hypothetical protein